MKNKKIIIFFIAILCIAAFLRIWKLGDIPSGLHNDEADIGYIAYSILKIGRSPYGDTNPFAIQEAWGGSRVPLYIYSVVPSIAVFGLTPFAVRFPSAIYGILSVLVTFFLLRKLFHSDRIGLLGALLFATNPWAIHISRQGLLESIAVFFVLTGIYFFTIIKKSQKYYVLSAIFFSASLFSYDAPKIFLPLFLPLLLWFYRGEVIKNKKHSLVFVSIFVFFYVLMLTTTFIGKQTKDFEAVSLFRWDQIKAQVDAERHLTLAPLWLSSIFHNKVIVVMEKLLHSYGEVFTLNWFFISGYGNLQESVARHGQYLLFSLPFFFIGLSLIILHTKEQRILLWWMILGAIPGALTTGNYAYRSVLFLPVPIFLTAIGIDYFVEQTKKITYFKKPLLYGTACIGLLLFLQYFNTYYFDYPVYASEYWSKQQQDILADVIEKRQSYDSVFVVGRWETPYAFFTRTDPNVFLKAYKNQEIIRGIHVMKLDNVYFGEFSQAWKNSVDSIDFFPNNSLIAVDAQAFPDYPILKKYPDPAGVRLIYKLLEINKNNGVSL